MLETVTSADALTALTSHNHDKDYDRKHVMQSEHIDFSSKAWPGFTMGRYDFQKPTLRSNYPRNWCARHLR